MAARNAGDETDAGRRRDFLAMVAHELRSPITVLIGHSEVIAELGESLPSARRTELARDILEASLRLSQLVDDLDLIGRLESGRAPEPLRPVDLAACFRAAMDRDAAPLATSLDGLPPVLGHPELVGRALAGIVENARKASATVTGNAVDPEVRAVMGPESVQVEVTDSAGRIPEAERALVFRRLERTPGGGSRRPHTLGLTVARVVAEALGGAVGVEDSRGGDGATVWLRLVRAAGPPADPNV